jgi:Domain of unknown function (DUF6468)
MSGPIGLMIEMIVSGLLAVTIGYCVLLDRRLRAMRKDEASMRKMVGDLSLAADRAERAIEALRKTLGDCDRTLGERLRVAEQYTVDLEEQIRSGDDVLTRISKIVNTAIDQTPAGVHPMDIVHARMAQSSAKPGSRINQTLAAAQALAAQANVRARDQRSQDNVA